MPQNGQNREQLQQPSRFEKKKNLHEPISNCHPEGGPADGTIRADSRNASGILLC
jgi:hypothetical protein